MTALRLQAPRRPAKIGLTPLIDVVFILMVFFMLASTFARERQIVLDARPIVGGGGGSETRLLVVGPDSLTLDGAPTDPAAALAAFRATPEAIVAVKPVGGATLQRLIDMADMVRDAGVDRVVLAR